MLPEDGRKTPVNTLKTVVFPAPFGPIRALMEPDSMFISSWCTAVSPPKFTVTLSSSSSTSDIYSPASYAPPAGVAVFFNLENRCLKLRMRSIPPKSPPGRKIIMSTIRTPYIIIRYSAENRSISGAKVRMVVPRTAPGMLPNPPSTTKHRISKERAKPKSDGFSYCKRCE